MTNQTANQNTVAAQNVNVKEESAMSINTIINITVVSEVKSLTAKQIKTYKDSVEAILGLYEATSANIMFAGEPAGCKVAAMETELSIPFTTVGVNQEKAECFRHIAKAAAPCQKAISHAHVVLVLGGKEMGQLAFKVAKEANKQHKDCYGILCSGETVDATYDGKEQAVVEPLTSNSQKEAVKEEAPKTEVKKEEEKKVKNEVKAQTEATTPAIQEMEKQLAAKKAYIAKAQAEADKLEADIKAAKEALAEQAKKEEAINKVNTMAQFLIKAINDGRNVDIDAVLAAVHGTIATPQEEVKEKKYEKAPSIEKILAEPVDTTGDILQYRGAVYEVLVSDFDPVLSGNPAEEIAQALKDGRIRLIHEDKKDKAVAA